MPVVRILHCIPTMEGGGAERQLTYVCQGLVDLGWEVHVALLRGGTNWERLRATGSIVHIVSSRSNYDPCIPWSLYRIIKKTNPQIVQTWVENMDVNAGLAARVAKVPWILSELSSALAYPFSWKNRLRSQLARGVSAIIANSSSGADYWHQRLRNRVVCHIIRNPLPLHEIEQVYPLDRQALNVETDQKIVLFAGRFVSEKNIENLVLGLREVLSQSNAVAFLCGDGPLRLRVEELLRRYALQDRVQLPGYVTNLWAWMKVADVFVSVSFYEGMPNTVAEAMACGCPLVVSDIPQHREMLKQDSALFVDPNQPNAIADAILQVLQQPEEAIGRARYASRIASEWSISSIVKQYANVYQGVLNRT